MESTNMQSLTAFQQAYPEGFKSITVDITDTYIYWDFATPNANTAHPAMIFP